MNDLAAGAALLGVALSVGPLCGATVTFTGGANGKGTSWAVDANWDTGAQPTASDDVVIDGKTVNVSPSIAVRSLTVRGATGVLNLGSSADRPNVSATIAEDFAVSGGATVNVFAGRLPDYVAAFEEGRTAYHAALYANANTIVIGGNAVVGAGSSLKPNNDPLTGTPVFFRIGGDFSLEAGGTVSANNGGWGWLDKAGQDVPQGAYTGTHKSSTVNGVECFTLAASPGNSYTAGGSYGGLGYGSQRSLYGLERAPYLPGSPGGAYTNTAEGRGGGSICLFVAGTAALDGTLTAQAGATGYSRGSGGGIWVVADSISPGAALAVNAKGCNSSSGNYAPGGGGRVAFEAGVTAEDIAAFLAGNEPERLAYDTLALAGLNVEGGIKPQFAAHVGKPGTAVNIFDPTRTTVLTVSGAPLNAVAEGVAYGDQVVAFGSVTRSAVGYGYDAGSSGKVRYSCTGYVVSNATAEVARGSGSSVTFSAVSGAGPYTLRWLWGERETRQTFDIPATGLGTVSVDGAAVAETASLWYPESATVEVTAVPAEGASFACWQGDVFWPNMAASTFALSAAEAHSVSPRFYVLRPGAVRTWKGNSGDYYDAANWTDGVVPGPQDTVVIAKGACTAKKYLAVGALTLSGGSLEIAGAYEVKVAGDVTLTNAVTLTVGKAPRTADRTFETGTAQVEIGGDLRIVAGAMLKVLSDAWTGGSPVFRVAGDFTLDQDSSVDADQAGWNWVSYTGAKSPLALATATGNGQTWQTMALGYGGGYWTAGTYGGRGGQNSGALTGVPYGFANAPFYPGSPNGVYGDTVCTAGGGLIRIHTSGRASVAGRITAQGGTQGSNYGGSSGGGIWLTAGRFQFAPTAVLTAKGGKTNYASAGGGGRIAIGMGLTTAQIAELVATGSCRRRVRDLERFQAMFPGVTVDVSRGSVGNWTPSGEAGTFRYFPLPPGMVIVVR